MMSDGGCRYRVTAPRTPGAVPSVIGTADTIGAARKIARGCWSDDLRGQDVRIETLDGQRVEYSGPAR
jgi:hypothetical protein